MIFKNLTALCRQRKRIWMYGDPEGVQWVSEGNALYPLHGMPGMTGEVLARVFDVPEKDIGKYSIKQEAVLPAVFDYSDAAKGAELLLTPEPIILKRYDAILCPVQTSRGLMFYDPELLKPLRDLQDTLTIHERATKDGTVYFAVKAGFLLQAIILPKKVDNVLLLAELQGITQALLETVEGERDEEDEDEDE